MHCITISLYNGLLYYITTYKKLYNPIFVGLLSYYIIITDNEIKHYYNSVQKCLYTDMWKYLFIGSPLYLFISGYLFS